MNNDYLNSTKEIARNAGKIITDNLGHVGKVTYKGEINLVTEIDKKTEDFIIKSILDKYPDHKILAEESGGHEERVPFKWIIDPIDGTTNFVHQFPFYCVSIALEIDGQVFCGAVYDPSRDELFSVQRGEGAFLNDTPISVSQVKDLKQSMLATGFAYNLTRPENNNFGHFQNFLMRAQAIRRPGAAALDLAYVACGRMDGFWEMDLKPWDVAAGYLLVEEAGGRVTQFDGTEYSIYSKNLLSSNGSIHKQMEEVLTK